MTFVPGLASQLQSALVVNTRSQIGDEPRRMVRDGIADVQVGEDLNRN